MKARNLILTLGLTALTLSGPVLAGDKAALRQALHADASESIRAAGSEMRAEALAGFRLENLNGTSGIFSFRRPELLLVNSLILAAESDAEGSDEAGTNGEKAPEAEESILGGLVVYSGNR